ncbi:MAG: glycosyltransferase [Anaerolineales bacterium]|nr:glycosyltransferase [Anaerolineales bacterium]
MKPIISVVVPCYNERETIGLLLEALCHQTFPHQDFEVIVADGMSTDGTRQAIIDFAERHPQPVIRLVDNPKGIIPSAINRGIEHASGELIVRLDAHSVPKSDYLERCYEVSQNVNVANVGGIWEIQTSENSWIGRSIAVAAAHPLGAGDARYRSGGEAGEVHTVPFGAFQRRWIEKVGRFNESLLSNEDYEYNYRIRKAGGKIWFDPSIESVYFARGNLLALGRQYRRYGFWKAVMLIDNPDSLRWRQAIPALFVLGILCLALLTLWNPLFGTLLAAYLGIYIIITGIAGLIEAIRRSELALILGFPLSLWTMHLSWGGAFLWGMISRLPRRQRGSRT